MHTNLSFVLGPVLSPWPLDADFNPSCHLDPVAVPGQPHQL